jgi:hypothetical protein
MLRDLRAVLAEYPRHRVQAALMTRTLSREHVIWRWRLIAVASAERVSVAEAADRVGLTRKGLTSFLDRFGFAGWPLDPRQVQDCIAAIDSGIDRARSGERRRYSKRLDSGVSSGLPAEQIAAMVEAAETARAEREAYWLRLEQEKYGLPRPGKPISGMVA